MLAWRWDLSSDGPRNHGILRNDRVMPQHACRLDARAGPDLRTSSDDCALHARPIAHCYAIPKKRIFYDSVTTDRAAVAQNGVRPDASAVADRDIRSYKCRTPDQSFKVAPGSRTGDALVGKAEFEGHPRIEDVAVRAPVVLRSPEIDPVVVGRVGVERLWQPR